MINGLVSKGATRTCMKSLSVIALTCTVPKTHLTSACTGERKPLEAVSSTVAPPRTSAKYGEMDSAWTIVAVFRRMQRTTRRPTDAIANVLPADGMRKADTVTCQKNALVQKSPECCCMQPRPN